MALTLEEKLARAGDDCDLLHQIVHGDAETEVATDNGNVPSAAKAVADLETEATTARDQAQAAATAASGYADDADASAGTAGTAATASAGAASAAQAAQLAAEQARDAAQAAGNADLYDPATTYDLGMLAFHADLVWRCLADGTVGIEPGTDATKWARFINAGSTALDSSGSSLTGDNVQAGMEGLAGRADTLEGDSHNTHAAVGVSYDNATSGLPATTVQAGIDETVTALDLLAAVANANQTAIGNMGTAIGYDVGAGAGQVPTNSMISVLPVSTVLPLPLETPPSGFLECDGSAVSRTTYATLFAAIGETHGVGDGSTTFNIPDYRDEFLRGWGHGRGADPDAASRTDRGDGTTGDNVGTKQGDQFKTHTISATTNNPNIGQTPFVTSGAADRTITVSGGNETRPRNVNVMFCIKY